MTDRQTERESGGRGRGGSIRKTRRQRRQCYVMAPICRVSGPSCERGPARPDQRRTSGAAPTPHASHPLPSCPALRAGPSGCLRDCARQGSPRRTHGGGGGRDGASLPESNPNGGQEAAGRLQTAGGSRVGGRGQRGWSGEG